MEEDDIDIDMDIDDIEDESWDSDEDYKFFENELDGEDIPDLEDFELNLTPADFNLGTGTGTGMKLSEEEIADIKVEATEAINQVFDARLEDIENIRENFKQDALRSKAEMTAASEQRAQEAKRKLVQKIDGFLSATEVSRAATKEASSADQNMAARGLDFGSWGQNEAGLEVVTTASGGGEQSADPNAGSSSSSPSSSTTSTSRVVIVVDESKVRELS
jgi:hypothetical protein